MDDEIAEILRVALEFRKRKAIAHSYLSAPGSQIIVESCDRGLAWLETQTETEKGTVEAQKPREHTIEEIREMFLRYVWQLIDYWEHQHKDTIRELLDGLAFSILAALDGESAELPGFAVIPDPHKEDKDYSAARGLNWFPPFVVGNPNPCDIGGSLHELFYPVGRKIKGEE